MDNNGDCSPGSTGNKSKNIDENSEKSLDKQNKEEHKSADYTNEINKSVAPDSAGEGTQERKDQPEADIENQGNTLRQMPDDKADLQNKDSPDNGPNISTNQDNDLSEESQYSHAVPVDGVRISMPGEGNLKIFDVSSVPVKPKDNDISVGNMEDIVETPNTDKEDEVSGPPNAGKEDIGQNMGKEEALAALRKVQTYDEEEDFIDYAEYQEKFEKAKEKFVFFWKSHDIYSQWHHSVFTVNGRKFFNAEQYMMFKKADLFGDEEIAKQILKSKDPRKIKALGRKVKGFNQNIWQQHCLHIVKEGNMAKFLQMDKYLADILFTYPKVLVEASPLDRIWGIGLVEEDQWAWNESTWQGTNYLGYVLTEVRDDIMVERGMIDDQDRPKYIDIMLAGFDVPAATGDLYCHIGEGAGRQGDEKPDKVDPDKDMGSHDTNKESYYLFDSGFFSQFYHTHFVVDNTEFSSAEQYMMYRKAKLFNDNETAKAILNKTEPKKIKHLGRQVKGFNEEIWRKNCLNIVKEGNKAKFSQNEKLKKAIVTTYPKVFVEANPYDRIWGIGLKIKDPKAAKRHTWQGKNFLGYVLTEVRNELMYEWGLLKKEKVTKYIEKLQKDWVDDATQNNAAATFPKSNQTNHSKETNVDDWWENEKQNEAVNNTYRNTTEDTRKGRQGRNMKTDHNTSYVDHKEHHNDNRDRRNDHPKHVDEHQKYDDWSKRDHNKSSSQQRTSGHQQHVDNIKKHVDKENDNISSKGNRKQQNRSHSPLRNEPVAHKADRQLPVNDVKAQVEKTGKTQATNTDNDSKQIKEKVKPKEVTKSEKSNKKGSKVVEKQDNNVHVDEFDISFVMESISKNEQTVVMEPQSPSNKTGKKKKDHQNIDASEEVHNASANRDEGTLAKKPSRRQKKNAKKKQS